MEGGEKRGDKVGIQTRNPPALSGQLSPSQQNNAFTTNLTGREWGWGGWSGGKMEEEIRGVIK